MGAFNKIKEKKTANLLHGIYSINDIHSLSTKNGGQSTILKALSTKICVFFHRKAWLWWNLNIQKAPIHSWGLKI